MAAEGDREATERFYEKLREQSIGPLWTATGGGNGSVEPRSRTVPYLWRWQEVRPLLTRTGELVPIEQATRRVLRLLNPGVPDRRTTTSRLFAGIQMVLPGEVAPAHRHTPAALRFVIEGAGGLTSVNGERFAMWPGDLILTPNWTWHDHVNSSDVPMIWLDGLDIVMVELLEAVFQEPFGEEQYPLSTPMGASLAKYGSGALRPAWESPTVDRSPLLHYPWRQTRDALERLSGLGEGSPFDGIILEYTNPATAGPVMPTIACYAQLLRPGERTSAHRHTSSTVYHVVEGRGSSIVDGERLDWSEHDTFCVPGWAFHEHANNSADKPAVLFSYSDTPALRDLQLYREETHPNGHQ